MRHHHLRPAHSWCHAGRRRPCPPPSRNSRATCFSRIGISVPTLIVSLLTLGVATTGLIYTISNYNTQQIAQAENQRREELRTTLRQYYTEVTNLLREYTNLPPDIPSDEVNRRVQKADEFKGRVYQWSKQNLGDAAADTLTEGQPTITYNVAHGSEELNKLLNSLFSFREDIKKLIESNMWNRMQK